MQKILPTRHPSSTSKNQNKNEFDGDETLRISSARDVYCISRNLVFPSRKKKKKKERTVSTTKISALFASVYAHVDENSIISPLLVFHNTLAYVMCFIIGYARTAPANHSNYFLSINIDVVKVLQKNKKKKTKHQKKERLSTFKTQILYSMMPNTARNRFLPRSKSNIHINTEKPN